MSAFVTLLLVVDPVGLVPAFLSATYGLSEQERTAIAIRSPLIAAAMLVALALCGNWLLRQLGIDPDAGQRILEVWNKIDRFDPEMRENLQNIAARRPPERPCFLVSAETGEGVEALLAAHGHSAGVLERPAATGAYTPSEINPQSQNPNPRQTPNSQKGGRDPIGVWLLRLGFCLGFGAWDLGFPGRRPGYVYLRTSSMVVSPAKMLRMPS